MTKKEFKDFLRQIPKAELHLHLEAVISLAGIRKMYKKRFGTPMPKTEQNELFSYDDLNGFIQSFLKVQSLYTSVEDFNIVFEELSSYLVKNGIVYSEVFFAPTAFLKMGFKYSDMLAIFNKKIQEIKEKHGITVKLIMDVSRTFGLENALNNYYLLKSNPCNTVIGIGLGGAESKGPAKDFAPVYAQAIKDSYKVVAHAGEDVGPESIWEAIDSLHVQRIGHGITAIQDENLLKQLKETQLPLEVCITSNTFTKKVVSKVENHPIKDFYNKGLMLTINTDDPVFFKTNLLEEYWICYKNLKFSTVEIKELVKNSFKASFLSDEEKAVWLGQVEKAFVI